MKPIYAIFIVAAGIGLTSCTHTSPATSTAASKPTPKSQPVAIKDEKLATVYAQYIELKNALVKSDSVSAKVAGNKLSSSLEGIPGCSGASKIAGKVNVASTLEAQRHQFVAISSEVIPVFKQAALAQGKIFVQFCPMADDGKGAYWLSSEKEIKNPYYGADMLECGEVKQVIN